MAGRNQESHPSGQRLEKEKVGALGVEEKGRCNPSPGEAGSQGRQAQGGGWRIEAISLW